MYVFTRERDSERRTEENCYENKKGKQASMCEFVLKHPLHSDPAQKSCLSNNNSG